MCYKELFLILLLFLASPALAAETKQAPATLCGINSASINELETIQKNATLEYAQKIQKELGIRRTLLKTLVDCAIEETQNLQNDFDNVDQSDQTVKELKQQFYGWFQSTINYYKLRKKNIDDLGIGGSKEFAGNLAGWREGNHKATANIISNFVLWAKNQTLMQAAKNRFNQAVLAVDLLKITPEYWEVKRLLNEANGELQTALSLNQKAKNAIKTYAPPQESLDVTKESLSALASSYQKLFNLVDAIKKSLEEK